MHAVDELQLPAQNPPDHPTVRVVGNSADAAVRVQGESSISGVGAEGGIGELDLDSLFSGVVHGDGCHAQHGKGGVRSDSDDDGLWV